MDRALLQLAIATTLVTTLATALAASLGVLLAPDPAIAQNYAPYQDLPPARRAEHVEIVQGPALELARDDLAIIRWTTNNPGGTDDHLAVIHYGTDPTKLSQTAQSPVRLNRDHAQTVFRVRVEGLQPQTTYYYTVTSMGSDGVNDGEQSSVEQFTTPGPGHRT